MKQVLLPTPGRVVLVTYFNQSSRTLITKPAFVMSVDQTAVTGILSWPESPRFEYHDSDQPDVNTWRYPPIMNDKFLVDENGYAVTVIRSDHASQARDTLDTKQIVQEIAAEMDFNTKLAQPGTPFDPDTTPSVVPASEIFSMQDQLNKAHQELYNTVDDTEEMKHLRELGFDVKRQGLRDWED